MAKAAIKTETPFNYRHCCWFCGEPHQGFFTFPTQQGSEDEFDMLIVDAQFTHPALFVESCHECRTFASQPSLSSIWEVRRFVKEKLITTYAKHLAIGVNWTQEELANSDFEQGNFAGFARSAWFMFEVAKGRVNFQGWPLVIDGVELNEMDYSTRVVETFGFDGVLYPSISEAVTYYCNVFYIDKSYFYKVLRCIVSEGSDIDQALFAKTVRFCRLLVNASSHERKVALQGLEKSSSMSDDKLLGS
jgi:hypothetical protein